ncbi:hypothetical protein CRYUN_Cryun10bG0029000 [Craigia yunnanensis]
MSFLTLSASLPGLKPPPFHQANVEDCKKASTLHIFFGTLFANTVLVYIQDNVGRTLGFGLPTLGLVISVLIFLAGTPFFRHRVPAGIPFTRMTLLIVVAIRKWKVPLPSAPTELYELDLEEYARKGKFRIDSTPTLRFLNKAAVKTGSSDPWMPCSAPPLKTHGQLQDPLASLAGFVTISMLVCVVLYDRFFVPIMKKWTKNPRGITLLQRMGIGLAFHIIIMMIAALIERHRLNVAREHGLVESGEQFPLTIFILLPQFVLMGTADAFLEVAKIEFFYDQAPESMKSLVLNFLNFIFFLVVIKFYVYKAEVSDTMHVLTEELTAMRLKASNQEESRE